MLTRAPSAELRPDQKDTDALPPYEVLDPILEAFIEEDLSVEQIVARGFARETVARVLDMVKRNEYKRRQAPPGVRVSGRAFGRDWRYPITSGYRLKTEPRVAAGRTRSCATRPPTIPFLVHALRGFGEILAIDTRRLLGEVIEVRSCDTPPIMISSALLHGWCAVIVLDHVLARARPRRRRRRVAGNSRATCTS